MSTIQDFTKDSTPANKYIVKALGLIKGMIACKVIYAANLSDKVCRIGLSRMSDELGISTSTVSRALEWLVDNEYILKEVEATTTTPAHYTPSQKLLDLLPGGIAECNRVLQSAIGGIAECNQDKNTEEEINKTTSNGLDLDFGDVCKVYENEIGLLSPIVASAIKALLGNYPRDWIIDAIKVAVEANVRRINYVEGILKRWKIEGKGNGKCIRQPNVFTPTARNADGSFNI